MHKYSEGYSGARYYQGNKIIDEIENLAIDRGKKLFGVEHLNVQPYSGSPANMAVLMALVNSGDTICGLKLSSGGHLTHGHPNITFSGKCNVKGSDPRRGRGDELVSCGAVYM